MTTNVVVSTYHGVVLGCDSLSSVNEKAFFPFRQADIIARDENGDPLKDKDGNLLLKYTPENLVNTPTNIMSGVQKMFLLHEDKDEQNIECSVAAITAGLGSLNGMVIAEVASNFMRKVSRQKCGEYKTADEVVNDFIDYIRPLWEEQVEYNKVDEIMRNSLPALHFLIAGYGPEDGYIRIFRVHIESQTTAEQFPEFPHCGAAWAGQANAIASLVNGATPTAQWAVGRAFTDALQTQRETIAASIISKLKEEGVDIPEPFAATVDAQAPTELPWNDGGPAFDWPNLPVQSAVDLASTLVNAESAIQKFSMGIPTVGGRTRIGLMRRGVPFEFLNEPKITHQHVGYNNDV